MLLTHLVRFSSKKISRGCEFAQGKKTHMHRSIHIVQVYTGTTSTPFLYVVPNYHHEHRQQNDLIIATTSTLLMTTLKNTGRVLGLFLKILPSKSWHTVAPCFAPDVFWREGHDAALE